MKAAAKSVSGLHVHLDPVGGLAGDMFCAAMLDAFPALAEPMIADLEAAGLLTHVRIEIAEQKVNGLAARQFDVVTLSDSPRATGHYKHIRKSIDDSSLAPPVRDWAFVIFDHLADAEAAVHQVNVDDVHFHEVADWDSLADIVAAASLIHRSGATDWSCAALPLGSGTVQTEHGRLPVPAPATMKLLAGFEWCDDNEAGERVTPTGAAILRALMTSNQGAARQRPNGRLVTDGTGCGSRRFKSIPNVIRLFAIDELASAPENTGKNEDQVAVLAFEIDDMTPEELAMSLSLLQDHEQVLDASYQLRIGKKGRPQFAIQVLTLPLAAQTVADICLTETTTLGVRLSYQQRRVLDREMTTIEVDGQPYPVKWALRPDGSRTAKVEADALKSLGSFQQRRRVCSIAANEPALGKIDD